jgi:hypothetical protein
MVVFQTMATRITFRDSGRIGANRVAAVATFDFCIAHIYWCHFDRKRPTEYFGTLWKT